jgi:hypothetical protein
MSFKCKKCSRHFKLRTNLLQHSANKNSCGEEKIAISKMTTCNICDIEYKSKSSLNRHIRSHHKGVASEGAIGQRREIIGDKNIKGNENNHVNGNENNLIKIKGDNNKIINIKTLNILVLPYGHEDLSFVTDEFLVKFFEDHKKNMMDAIPDFIKAVHCDLLKPQNNNIAMAKHTKDGAWCLSDNQYSSITKKDLIDDLQTKKSDFLRRHVHDLDIPLKLSNLFVQAYDDSRIPPYDKWVNDKILKIIEDFTMENPSIKQLIKSLNKIDDNKDSDSDESVGLPAKQEPSKIKSKKTNKIVIEHKNSDSDESVGLPAKQEPSEIKSKKTNKIVIQHKDSESDDHVKIKHKSKKKYISDDEPIKYKSKKKNISNNKKSDSLSDTDNESQKSRKKSTY